MARKILKTKYGKPYLVANAWIVKIMSYPKLSCPASMSTFANELKSAKEMLTTMGYLSELDNTDKRRLIVAKLPSFVQNRWRKIHCESNDNGVKCTIDQLVNLISQAGDEMDDPIYGAESLAKLMMPAETKKTQPKKKGLASHAMEQTYEPTGAAATSREPRVDKKNKKFAGEPCCLCQGEHFTRRCADFENMSPEERARMVKDKNICVMCLSTRHVLKDCRFDWVCQVKGCTGKHNTTLHAALAGESATRKRGDIANHRGITMRDGHVKPEIAKGEFPDVQMNDVSGVDTHTCGNQADKLPPVKLLITRKFSKEQMEVFALPTLPVIVHGPGFTVNTNLMLDTGGGFTVISRRLQDEANLRSHKQVEYSMGTLTSDEDVVSEFVTFKITGLIGGEKFPVINASVLDRELVDPDSVDALRDLSMWPHLRKLKMPLHEESDVDIILGQDNAHLLNFREKSTDITWRGPRANMTPLGWTVFGLRMGVINTRTHKIHLISRQATEKLRQAVENMWLIDDVPNAPMHTPENQAILKMWNAEAKLVDSHVELPLPIKGGKLTLPNNQETVLKRHRSLEKRLLKNPDLKAKFVEEMKRNFEKGYAEIAEGEAKPGAEWYHPIQGVTSPKKPGKCRIVGDLSCTHDGRCLNDDIAQGPNFTVHIAQVMTKFRRYQIAVVGDIEKMYNQVRVPPWQRDCLRFYWWKDDGPGNELIKCRTTTQMFGGIWLAAAAMFALVWLAGQFGHLYAARVVETILDHFYVDDMLDSLSETQKTIDSLKDVRSLLMRGSFNLTKIGSNSQAVLDSIPEEARAPAYAEISFDKGEYIVDQTVGSVWRPNEDMLGFRTVEIDRPHTRRGVLSVMSSLYDPIGLVAPFVLLARILLQDVCKLGYDWDEEIDESLQARWDDWLTGLNHIKEFRIPRWLEAGYGVALYLLIKHQNGGVMRTSLLCSKAKVTPVKPVTIPRLELCAAVVAVKMEDQMKSYLDVAMEPSVFWCDSQIVINYLRGEAWQYKTFVSHRVLFIQEHTEVEQWRHIPGELNIADKSSRGMSGREMFESTDWKEGPSFLKDVELWPVSNMEDMDRAQLEVQKRTLFKFIVHRDEEGAAIRRIMTPPFGEQMMAPLSEHCVTEGRAPFKRIGVDYFGPVHVKINRTTQKRWISMIVCLATRAVHIEPVHDLSTASFLNVMQRFISRRGRPQLVVSDNGTNFVGAKREMREAWDDWNQENIGRFMAELGIEWRFNTPTASHRGGIWERLIRSARNLIMALLRDQMLNDDKLNTLCCSVEQIMNSRPLTTASDQPGEPLPITPNHLLNLRKAEGIEGSYEKGDTVDRKWKQVQYLADIFWKRWTTEYLQSLQKRDKWRKPKKNLSIGDVVLVLQEGMPRLKWPIRRIVEAIVGIDGLVRSVKVKTEHGQYLRPITKLVPLECD